MTLWINGAESSYLDLQDPLRLEFAYMQHMAAVIDQVPTPDRPVRVVHLGAAGCALARRIDATRVARQVAVEIDPVLADQVRGWFDLPRSPRLRIRVGDARAELAGLAGTDTDVVVRDVFAGDHTPRHVTTAEFVEDVARALRPGGVYLANCVDRPPLVAARSELATLAAVLPRVGIIAEPAQLRGRRYGNLVLVGTTDPDLLDDPELHRALRRLAVPARLLHGAEVPRFTAGAAARHDADTADSSH